MKRCHEIGYARHSLRLLDLLDLPAEKIEKQPSEESQHRKASDSTEGSEETVPSLH